MKPFNIPWRELKDKNHYLVHVHRDLIHALNELDFWSGFSVVCHILYDDERAPTNMHRQGKAADLHLEGVHPLDQFLFVQRLNIFTGIGLYGPDVWRNPGLHLDIRDADKGARWAFKRTRFADGSREQVPLNKEYIKYLLEIMP